MQTANYATAKGNANAVSISMGKPAWYRGRSFSALAPLGYMMKMKSMEFADAYRSRVLNNLNAEEVFRMLGNDAVLLCFEPFNVQCHRRLVAEWLEEKLGIEVPELGHARSESLLYFEMPATAPKKPAKPATLMLF